MYLKDEMLSFVIYVVYESNDTAKIYIYTCVHNPRVFFFQMRIK